MELQDLNLKVPKAENEIGKAVGDICRVIGTQLSDGFQAGADVSAIATSVVASMITVLSDFKNVKPDFSEDAMMSEGILQYQIQLGVRDMLRSLKKIS